MKLLEPFRSSLKQSYLLKEFVIRDVQGRFAGSMAGTLWTIINPIATILSYYFVFSIVLRVSVTAEETGTDNFSIFFLSGFFLWIMFADAITKSTGILVEKAGLITKVVFPVELLPVSAVISTFILQGIGFIIFLCYLMYYGYFHPIWALLPILLAVEALFVLGLSYFCSALCVFIRDTGEVLNILLMLWFFGTPIIYPVSMIPDQFKVLLKFNPMFQFIDLGRDILLNHRVDLYSSVQIFGIAILFYMGGAWFFMKSKNAFGDVL